MQDHSIALDPHATQIIIGPGRAVSAAELAAMTTDVIDLSQIRQPDVPAAHHRHRAPQRRHCPRWLARVGDLLKYGLPLVVGVLATGCAVVFTTVVIP